MAGLVSKLIDAERTPTLTRLAGKEATLQAQLSGFGQLRGALDKVKSALDGLNSPTLLTAYRATSADDTRYTASADASAAPGSYAVEVTALAKAQKLASGAFSGPDAAVGTGTLTLALGGKSAAITIDDSNKTLSGIRDAINAARDADGKPLGVTATLVTSTGGVEPAGTYLVLTSSKTGAANTIGLTQTGGDGGLAAIQYETGGLANGLTEKEPPADAVVKVDGFTYASATNTVTGALGGVTLNLKATTTAPVTLAVSADTGSVRGRMQALVDAYNGLHKVVQEQGGYNTATRRGGVLIGEPALRNIESQLRRVLSNPLPGASGALKSGADIGLSLDSTGKLTLDGAKFDAALSGDRGAPGTPRTSGCSRSSWTTRAASSRRPPRSARSTSAARPTCRATSRRGSARAASPRRHRRRSPASRPGPGCGRAASSRCAQARHWRSGSRAASAA